MRTAGYTLALVSAGMLAACVPAGDQEALRAQAVKEWQSIPSLDDVGEHWRDTWRQTDQGLVISCGSPSVRERSISQNGVNDGITYRQCPPLAPPDPATPLPQPWPPAQVGQRLDARS